MVKGMFLARQVQMMSDFRELTSYQTYFLSIMKTIHKVWRLMGSWGSVTGKTNRISLTLHTGLNKSYHLFLGSNWAWKNCAKRLTFILTFPKATFKLPLSSIRQGRTTGWSLLDNWKSTILFIVSRKLWSTLARL